MTTTQSPLVTIDAKSTRDIDDAISVLTRENLMRVTVAISDPTNQVTPGSIDDRWALERAATVYRRDVAAERMLAAMISEDTASLVMGKQRPAMVITIDLDDDCNKLCTSVEFRTITVDRRLTYEDVPALIRSNEGPLSSMLAKASGLAANLLAKRQNQGALAFFDLQRLCMTDEEGRLLRLPSASAAAGHLVVQELMILANTALASYLLENDVPCLFRNHVPKLAAPPAAELGQTLRAWLESGATDASSMAARLQSILGRAEYAPTLSGHYGLALPAYLHGTSPLRRYADLINVRQLKAHCQREQLPHGPADLQRIAESINRTLSERKESASDGYKAVLVARTQHALARERLEQAPDHVVVQAIKLMVDADVVDGALGAELIRRMESRELTDKIADALLEHWPLRLWPVPVAEAFARWLFDNPTRAMHVLLFCKQAGVLNNVGVHVEGSGASFQGKCSLEREGRGFHGEAQATRKRDAEQLAAAYALAHMLSVKPQVSKPEEAAEAPPGENPKGRLLEICQQRGWDFPRFESTGKGPSHAMQFTCTATVAVPGGPLQATAIATSKKHAEALASAKILGMLPANHVEPANSQTLEADNPVGALQERAQRRKVQLPNYEFRQKQVQPPMFEAIVTVYESDNPVSFTAFAGSKSEAKQGAAAKALAGVN